MRRSISLFATAVVTLTVGLVGAGPASAGGPICDGNATNAPDGEIKPGKTAWKGAGYPSTSKNRTVGPGEKVVFRVRWTNLSGTAETVRVKPGRHGFPFDGGISFQVFRGGRSGAELGDKFGSDDKGVAFRNVAPGQTTPKLKLVIANNGSESLPAWVQLVGKFKGRPPLELKCDSLGASINNN